MRAKKVEEAGVETLFKNPLHPYTLGLLASVPRLDRIESLNNGGERLVEIPGMVPSLHDMPVGCAFSPRCSFVKERCHVEAPPLEEATPGHWTACWERKKSDWGVGVTEKKLGGFAFRGAHRYWNWTG